jgi:hypothetical protein
LCARAFRRAEIGGEREQISEFGGGTFDLIVIATL